MNTLRNMKNELMGELEKNRNFVQLSEDRSNKKNKLNQINELRQKQKVIITCSAEHANIGDAAIVLAEQEILLKYYPEFFQVEFSTYEMREDKIEELYAITNLNDIIVIHGGGNLGDEYLVEEQMRRNIIQSFPNNKIIVFPQTIYFNDSAKGKEELEKTKKIYNRHRDLTIFARGQQSYAKAKEYFVDCKVELFPDTVTFLERDYSFDRHGALVSLRTDNEGVLSKQQTEGILKTLSDKKIDYVFCNNIHDKDITRDIRAKVVYDELQKYAKSVFAITDRLHGMIFASITKTPCIVLPTYNYKLSDYYDSFLKNSKNIIFLDKYDAGQLAKAIDVMKQKTFQQYKAEKTDYSKLRNF